MRKSIRYFLFAARVLISAVLIYAAISKIFHPFYFSLQIEAYQIIGPPLSIWCSIMLPWIELVAGISILVGFWVRPSSLIATGLFLLFTVAILSALVRGLDIECGCFGSSFREKVSWGLLVRDALFVALSLFIFFAYKEKSV